MSSAGDKERLQLFRLYAANLSNCFPELVGLFACPICGRFFREKDVLNGPGLKVDIGHTFPRELGGKLVTLECCECNRRFNRLGDTEVIKLQKQWDAMIPGRGGKPIRGHVLMPSGRIPAFISSNGIDARVTTKSPKAARAAGELAHAIQDHTPFEFSVPKIDRNKINIAALHSAHLLFFRAFGYGYLGSPGGKYVQQLLLNAEAQPVEGAFKSVEVLKPATIPAAMIFRVGICTMPDGKRCLFAALPVPYHPVVKFIIATAVFLLALPSAVFAWGGDGHQITCLIVEERLTAAAKDAIHDLLGKDVNIANDLLFIL